MSAEIRGGAKSLDVVTGYLSPAAFGILGDDLRRLERFRLLLGKDHELARLDKAEQEHTIAALVADAIRNETTLSALPTPLNAAEVRGFIEFLRRDDVEVRVWQEGFLHAKAYLFEAGGGGGSSGVGSANFTGGGLVANRELVAWREDRGHRSELRTWFEDLWSSPDTRDYKADLIRLLEHSLFGGYPFTPYEVFIRTLAERYGLEQPPSLSQASFTLQWFQEDAVYRLIKLLDGPAAGAILADAVGLGKTFMAMAVIHHLLYERGGQRRGRGRPVTILVPASIKPQWERELEEHGLEWACQVETLQKLPTATNIDRLAAADLVIVDEAHRLRGGGAWFQQVARIVREGTSDKQVLLLTATPVHVGIRDLTNLLRIMTKNRYNAFAPVIPDFAAYLKRIERREVDPFPLLDRIMVRRSRSDLVRAIEERQAAGIQTPPLALPKRRLAHAQYAYVGDPAAADALFDAFRQAIQRLRLAPYDLDRFRIGVVDDALGIPPSSLVGLIATGLFKRFESSLRAVRLSLSRHIERLDRFSAATQLDPPRLLRLDDSTVKRLLVADFEDDEEQDVEARWEEVFDHAPGLDGALYDLPRIRDAITEDIADLRTVLDAVPDESRDGKIDALIGMLDGSTSVPVDKGRPVPLAGRSILVFTEFRDTAEYIAGRLRAHFGDSVGLTHGGVTGDARRRLVAWFDPAGDSVTLRVAGEAEIKILVSTDVLAEGHNLQLADTVINFDFPWNPQVVVQRAGRVDRLGSKHDTITLVCFEPDEGLERHLNLLAIVSQRFGLVHLLGVGDESVTRLSGDVQSTTLQQIQRMYADDVTVLDELEKTWVLGSTDFMRAPLERFMANAGLERLREIPVGVQSIRFLPKGWKHGPGVFIALAHGGDDIWRFYPQVGGGGFGPALEDEVGVFHGIACGSTEPRADGSSEATDVLIDWNLLRRAAAEVAAALNTRRGTASLLSGASEPSRKLRARFRDAAERVGMIDDGRVSALLDRLDQIPAEQFDADPAYRRMMDRLRDSEKVQDAAEAQDAVREAVEIAVGLFGEPDDVADSPPALVEANDLRLISWEWLVERQPLVRPLETRML